LVVGEKGAESLLRSRNCLIKDLATPKIERFQVSFINEEEVKETINRIKNDKQ